MKLKCVFYILQEPQWQSLQRDSYFLLPTFSVALEIEINITRLRNNYFLYFIQHSIFHFINNLPLQTEHRKP